MLTSELSTELLSYFDLNREEYVESHSYLGVDMQQWISIVAAAATAMSNIHSFSSQDGFVVVNESNVSGVRQCISDMRTCMNMRTSQHRATLILLEYQFLAHFKWSSSAPQFVEYSGWGPCIFDLSTEQLAYYLWWREQAKNGAFVPASGEYMWLFIYECLLNTTGLTTSETRSLLEHLYNYYVESYPKPIHKGLSAEKLGFLIVNYSLNNGLFDDIHRLIQTYGIDDNYRKFQGFSSGKYRGHSKDLLSMVLTDVKPKGFTGSEEESFVLRLLPIVFEDIAKSDAKLHKMILADICGKLNDHALWNAYESPVLSANLIRRIRSKQAYRSFVIDGNTYVYAAGEDLAISSEIANNQYSWDNNDGGNNFHQKGMFYRNQYEGTTPVGRQVVTYIVRELQNKFRAAHGQRTLKVKEFPYSDYKDSVDASIRRETSNVMLTLQSLENDQEFDYVPDFLVLEHDVEAPLRFRFIRRPLLKGTTLSGHINDQSVECLVIDDDIVKIDEYAFCCCSNLEAVTGGFGLKSIGNGAFYNCTSLHTVVLQDGIQEIGSGAFLGCCNLNEIYIPNTVYKIGFYDESECVFDGNPIILCEHKSYAEQYARSHHIKYRIV